jgi:ABC-type Zn uptake system ZnuABC Zn-binding protein ZnuA
MLILYMLVIILAAIPLSAGEKKADKPKLKVVTTLPDYKDMAEAVGGERVTVQNIVKGDQDAHFIRPKPSFITLVAEADVLVSTGMDLELWLPSVIDKSGNTKIRSEQPGFVSASYGIDKLEVPDAVSRSGGGCHVYGNPHLTPSPLNMRTVARNIAAGLITNDPEGKEYYMKNLKALEKKFDEKLFGKELVKLLGGKPLIKLAKKGTLIDFLKKHKYKKKPLMDYLGGWMKKMLPLRGKKIVTYHKNWIYFTKLFGIIEAGHVEPKPGIPPSAKHVADLVGMMKKKEIKIILAANYFDEAKIKKVAEKTGAEPVIVPLYVGGTEDVKKDYFQLVDHWIDRLLEAAEKKGMIEKNGS